MTEPRTLTITVLTKHRESAEILPFKDLRPGNTFYCVDDETEPERGPVVLGEKWLVLRDPKDTAVDLNSGCTSEFGALVTCARVASPKQDARPPTRSTEAEPEEEYQDTLRCLEWARRAKNPEEGLQHLACVLIHGTRIGHDSIYNELSLHIGVLARPDAGMKELKEVVDYIFNMAELSNPDARKQAGELVDQWEAKRGPAARSSPK